MYASKKKLDPNATMLALQAKNNGKRGKVERGLSAVLKPVIQRTAKEDIVKMGFSEEQTEDLKTVVGGWVNTKQTINNLALTSDLWVSIRRYYSDDKKAKDLLNNLKVKLNQAYFDEVCKLIKNEALRPKVLNNCDQEHFWVLQGLFEKDRDALISKGIDNASIDALIASGELPMQPLSNLAKEGDLEKLGGLGPLSKSYPKYIEKYRTIGAGDAAKFNTVTPWLKTLDHDSHTYLNRAAPSLDVLLEMTKDEPLTNKTVRWLPYVSEEASPANNDTATINGSKAEYRLGHFLRGHALRYLDKDIATGGKTLWPLDTSRADVESVCKEFDDDKIRDDTVKGSNWDYTPTGGGKAAGITIRAANNWEDKKIDQLFPKEGGKIYSSEYERLTSVRALRRDWPNP
ncbi:hypothetical protein [Endozoicomonas lisbonensis]|uniref:Uncharacterized protein n=1 Tax=Endozoicomonas lisbonensis TaxID=3120522 RepID=A0ABV2SC34_9GAMM